MQMSKVSKWLVTTLCLSMMTVQAVAEPMMSEDGQSLRTQNRYCAKLPFVPYSSSYLPRKLGPLTNLVGEKYLTPKTYLAPLIYTAAAHQTVMERFDHIRATVLNRAPLSPYIESAFHIPSAMDWEGFCNQWSAASLNPTIANALQNSNGLVCGDTYISKGELKELFSALTPVKEKEFYGQSWRVKNEDPQEKKLAAKLGLDKVPALLFHTQVYGHLNRGEGFVIDAYHGDEVWNQPVYQACSDYQDISLDDMGDNVRAQLTLGLYRGQDAEASQLLRDLVEFRGVTQRRMNRDPRKDDGRKEEDKATITQWRNKLGIPNHGGFLGLGSGSGEFLKVWNDILSKKLIPMIRNRRIVVRDDVRLIKVRTVLNYAQEVGYGKDGGAVNKRVYDYYLVEKAGTNDPVDASWISAPEDRSDFLWVPETADFSKPANAVQQAAADLLTLMNPASGLCTDLKTMMH